MSRHGHVRRLFLVVISSIGVWLCLAAFYAGLPSWPHSWDQNPSEHLASGAKVTRIYKLDDFVNWYDGNPSVKAAHTGRHRFAIDFQLGYSARTRSSSLRLDSSHVLNLTDHWARSEILKSGNFYISDPIEVEIKTGDTDGINLPWFRLADATLLYCDIHHDSSTLPLRVRVKEDMIEIWPDSETWDNNRKPPFVQDPLLTLTNPNGFNSTRIHAGLPQSPTVQHSSPSTTFRLRLQIQRLLVPTGLFAWNYICLAIDVLAYIFSAIFEILRFCINIATFYVVIVLLAWLLSHRPPFWEWTKTFPLTSFLYGRKHSGRRRRQRGKLWGPTGPVNHSPSSSLDGSDSDEFDGPQPLTSPWAFFSSPSPLDDLLVTFAVTRHLALEPLGGAWLRSASRNAEGEDRRNVVGASSANIVRLDIGRRREGSRGGKDLEKGEMSDDLEKR